MGRITHVGAFALACLPFVAAGTVLVASPLVEFGGVLMLTLRPDLLTAPDAPQAEGDTVRPPDHVQGLSELPRPVLVLMAGLLVLAVAVVVVACIIITTLLISRYGSRMVLRAAHARPVRPEQEPALFRTVENLCIGAGLPVPAIHLIDSEAPNAFAVGRDPEHASLAFTRGLLALLTRRELEGVVAHELSHIGNHDIRLSLTLAALVGTLSLPLKMLAAPLRAVFRLHWAAEAIGAAIALQISAVLLLSMWSGYQMLFDPEFARRIPAFLWWGYLLGPPVSMYALLGAPVTGLLIRQAVSRQHEFLADADAVRLVRDPEGLALALAKIGAAAAEPLPVGEGTVHLYIVDPLQGRSWLHRIFPSHPPLEARVELLARMGSGIPASAFQSAREAGERHRRRSAAMAAAAVAREAPLAVTEARELQPPAPSDRDPEPRKDLTPVYEAPDGWSRVLVQLPDDAAVAVLGTDGHFFRVSTGDNIVGYVSRAARLRALANLTADARSTSDA